MVPSAFRYRVRRISSSAFKGCKNITSISIPEGVTYIGEHAFDGCSSLKSVIIPESVKSIGAYAFNGCSALTTVKIPNGVSKIPEYAFRSCGSLNSVVISEGVTTIGDYAFYACTSLRNIIIPDCVMQIGDYAFAHSGLSSVAIPSRVERIGSGAFLGCTSRLFDTNAIVGLKMIDGWVVGYTETLPTSLDLNGVVHVADNSFQGCERLESVSIPASVLSIGKGAFDGCDERIYDYETISGVKMVDGWIVGPTDEMSSSVDLTGASAIADSAFAGCNELLSIKISEGIKSVGVSAFDGCYNLMSISIPGSVKTIGSMAYYNCSGLMSARISNGVEIIGSSAFYGCNALTAVTIPGSVMRISDSAFSECRGLASLILTEGILDIGNSAFRYCNSLGSIALPNSVTNIGNEAFAHCSRLSEVSFGNNIVRIGSLAFQDCAIRAMSVPDTTECIGANAFCDCKILLNISMPFVGARRGNSGTIGYAFGEYVINGVCTANLPSSLRSITITDETVIGTSAFASCNMLTNITFSNSVRQISDSAFSGCSGLSEFKIPDGVETLGNNVFANCTGLKEMNVPESVELIGRGVFSGCSNLEKVTLPFVGSARGNTDAADSLFGHVFGTSSYTGGIAIKQYYSPIEYATYYIPSSLKSVVITDESCVGYGAFYGCGGLQSVTIPECTQTIGERAFYGCDSLLSIGFCGDAPDATDLSFEGISDSCIGRVASASSGWGESIPCVWHNLPIDYWRSRVTFDANGGSGGTDENLVVGSDVNVPAVERTGYAFEGWNPEAAATVPANDVTYIAQWTPKKYAVSFNSAGGNPTELPAIVVTYDSPYGELPTVTRDGYAFLGWVLGNDPIESNTIVAASCDHQLVAKWQMMSYAVRYDANGGIGEMQDDSFMLGVTSALSANAFRRTGYAFMGWGVSAEGPVVYADTETVLDLCDSPGGVITLFAVWVKDGSNVTFEFCGDAAWYQSQNIRVGEIAWQSGIIGDNQMSVIKTTVFGEGTISFDWQCSCEGFFRNIRLDYLGFCIDGEENTFINGSTDWTNVSFAVEGEGPHELLWRYVKDSAGSEYDDCGRLASVVWKPDMSAIDAFLNASNLTFSTSEDVGWFGQSVVSHDGVAAMRSGAISDGGMTRLECTVLGPGEVSFWWKSSCEAPFRGVPLDFVEFSVDGVQKEWIAGETEWTNAIVTVEGSGSHVLAWTYQKDDWEGTSDGEDCAWLDEVSWTSAAVADVAVDIGDGMTLMVSSGWLLEKTTRAATDVAANGRKVWECYVLGLDPEDATNDFTIVSFPMGADGLPDLTKIAFVPSQAQWNIQGAQPVLKGRSTLEGGGDWQLVTDENKAQMRFFKVDVVLP